jgi:hypothetical protein
MIDFGERRFFIDLDTRPIYWILTMSHIFPLLGIPLRMLTEKCEVKFVFETESITMNVTV